MTTEAGHEPNRSYLAQDGSFHLNGAAFYNDAEADISGSLELLNASPGTRYYVDPQNGDDDNDGLSWGTAFATMSALDDILEDNDVIFLRGVLREEWTAPIKNDVSLIGVSNQPRQATTSGVANGGGATWLSPASGATTDLLTLRGQGWVVKNIYFNQTTAGKSCIEMSGGGDPPDTADAAHCQILGCFFTGAKYGIHITGQSGWVTIAGNTFVSFGDSDDIAIAHTSGSGGNLWGWRIIDNYFYNNDQHVVLPLVNSTVRGNNFIVVGQSVTATVALSLTGGSANSVYLNMFNRPLDTSPNATLFVGGTNDVWSHNYGSDGLFYDVPDNS